MLLSLLVFINWIKKRCLVVDVRVGEEWELEKFCTLCLIVSPRVEIARSPYGCWEFVAVDVLKKKKKEEEEKIRKWGKKRNKSNVVVLNGALEEGVFERGGGAEEFHSLEIRNASA